MVYSDKHKTVLQTLIHEGALDENDGKELIIKLFDHDNATPIISEINGKLQSLNMTIKCINCEVTGKMYWILASTVQDTLAKFYPEYSQAELSLLRKVYSEIITSNNGYVSSTLCLNLCSSLNLKLSKASAEKFLCDIVKKKWLCYKKGQYYMGVRSMAELLQYFKDTYQGLQTCILCKQALFYGGKCDKCETTAHIYCLENAMDQNDLTCPNCHHSISEPKRPDDVNSTMDDDDTYIATEDN